MKMIKRMAIALGLMALMVVGCGGGKSKPPVIPEGGSAGEVMISGTYLPLNGASQLSFSSLFNKPLVIFLAGQFCISCGEETDEVKSYVRNKVPVNVNLLTLLVAAVNEDGRDWQTEKKVPWGVGTLADDLMIRKYCPAIQTPCTLVVDKAGRIIFSENGKVLPSRLEDVTGVKWEY